MRFVISGKHSSVSVGGMILCFCLLAFLLAGCGLSSGILSGGEWQSAGLAGQQPRVLAVRATVPTTLYAADAAGTVSVSLDSGVHWQDRSAGLPSELMFSALATTNDGKILYAATSKGLFETSAERAENWQQVAKDGLPSDSYTALAFSSSDANVIYLGTQLHGVFVTRDGGKSWRAINTGFLQIQAINDLALSTAQHQLWAASGDSVYRTDDRTISWQPLRTGLPLGLVVNTVVPVASSGGDENLVYLGTSKGFFRSVDRGVHWLRGTTTLQGTVIHRLVVDFRSTNVTTVFAATDIGVLRSDDEGVTWGSSGHGLPNNQPIYSLALGAEDYAQLYAASGAVYQYLGSSGGLSPDRLLPIAVVVLFFSALYYFARRLGRRRSVRLQPREVQEAVPTKTEE